MTDELTLKLKGINEWLSRNFTKEGLANEDIWREVINPHIRKELGLENRNRKLTKDEMEVFVLLGLKRYNYVNGYM